MRRLALAVGILALLAALAVAEEAGETLPWEVKVARLAAFEPGARGAAVVTLVFKERGVYGATFRLRTYAGRGEVATLAKGELEVDIYELGAYNVTLEGAVPSDVVCGAPVYVEGYVMGAGEGSYAVVRGEQHPFVVYYNLYVGAACPSAVHACAALVWELGGAEAVAGLLEECRQLEARVGSLAPRFS